MDLAKLTEYYSKALVHSLPHLNSEEMQQLAMTAAQRALQYSKDHPYYTAFAAVNAGLMPILGTGWLTAGLLKVIGFGPLGPYAGSLAAWYQSTYLGAYIPAGSVFAGLQRLAMG